MQTIKQVWASLLLLAFTTSAPAITDMDNNPSNIGTFVGKGKWAVAEIWASDCRMCQLSIQHIVSFKASHPEVDIIGISVDGEAGRGNAQTFIDEHQLSFPNLLSHKDEIDQYLFSSMAKNFIGTPTFLFYDPQGKLVTVQARALTDKELGKFIDSQDAPPQDIADPC